MLSLLWLFYSDVVCTTSLRFPYPPTVVLSYRALIMLLFVIIYHVRVHTYSCASYWLVFSIKFVAFRQCWLDVSLDGGLNVAHWRAPFLLVRCSDVWRVTASHAYSLLEALKDTPTSWWKCWRTRPLFDGILFSWRMCFLHMSVLTCLTWRSDVFLELLLFCILFKFYVLLYVSFVLLNY